MSERKEEMLEAWEEIYESPYAEELVEMVDQMDVWEQLDIPDMVRLTSIIFKLKERLANGLEDFMDDHRSLKPEN